MRDGSLGELIDAVMDGDSIDWSAVRKDSGMHGDRSAVNALHHLSLLNSSGNQSLARPSSPGVMTGMLVTASTALVALGLVGMTMYQPLSAITLLRCLTLFTFSITSVLLQRSPRNERAWDLSAVFLLVAVAFSRTGYRPLVEAFLGSTVSSRILSTGIPFDAWLPFYLWRFAQRFPSTLRFTAFDRLASAITRVSFWVGCLLFLTCFAVSVTGQSRGLAYALSLSAREGQGFSTILFLLILGALPVILARAGVAPLDERKRVRIFATSMLAGFSPVLIEVIAEALMPSYANYLRASPKAQLSVVVMATTPLVTIPIVTAYSVLVHRLLGMRFTVARGAQYLLSRSALRLAVAMPSVLLAWHVYTHRDESVTQLLGGGNGAFFGLWVLFALLLTGSSPLLLSWLDRMFDNVGLERGQILTEMGETFRLSRTRSELASAVEAAVLSGLKTRAMVHFHAKGHDVFTAAQRAGTRALSGSSAIATLLMEEPGLNILSPGPHGRLLPAVEQEWLRHHDAVAVGGVGLSEHGERPWAIVSIGERADGLPFTADDERFANALLSSASIAADNLRLRTRAEGDDEEDGFGLVCIRCGRLSDPGERRVCSRCQGSLQAAAVPRRVAKKFDVQAVLGVGGMGAVYLATDLSLRRQVALKTLPVVSDRALRMIGTEARVMADLSHPNLAQIYGTEEWRGTTILVCEYVAGGTLGGRLARGPLKADEAVHIVLCVIDGLEYMHSRGVLHQDIKPSNIGFASNGAVKLLDFGLSRFLCEPTPPGRTIAPTAGDALSGVYGTLPYLSPEALKGQVPAPSRDVWALSVVLAEAIVGRHLFLAGGDTPQNILHGRFDLGMEFVSEDPALAGVIMDALRPDSSKRLASVQGMKLALKQWQVSRGSNSREFKGVQV